MFWTSKLKRKVKALEAEITHINQKYKKITEKMAVEAVRAKKEIERLRSEVNIEQQLCGTLRKALSVGSKSGE